VDLAIKIGLMVLAMVVLYAIAHSFSDPKEAGTYLPANEAPPEPEPTYDAAAEEREIRQHTVGETTIQNYGFRTIDLRTGPADPEDFFDELTVRLYASDTGHTWQASYTVCTPKGIARFMREKGYDSLLASAYLVVERYDIEVIPGTILAPVEETGEYKPPDDPDQLVPPIPRTL
jgi:hypothetical protein